MARGRQMLTKEDREKRNALVLQFFLAGWSEREIARHHSVKLSPAGAHKVIKGELAKLAGRHDLLSDQALPMYLERLETLFKIAFAKAATGDLKAVEIARRIAEQQSRLWNLEEEGRLPAIPPISDQELEEDEGGDQLAKYRARRQRRAGA